jgi:RNA polymerase sigma-70 factor (ECF subfamily)
VTDQAAVLTTHALVERAAAGDSGALDALCGRCLPRLQRWARGRLPRAARSVIDTDDLAQDVLLRTLRNLDHFEEVHQGALQAYLRRALDNRIHDELRRTHRVPERLELEPQTIAHDPTPLEEAIGHEAYERFETALARLAPRDREAIIERMEFRASYAEVASDLGLPSAEAARKAVTRALLRLAHEMRVVPR